MGSRRLISRRRRPLFAAQSHPCCCCCCCSCDMPCTKKKVHPRHPRFSAIDTRRQAAASSIHCHLGNSLCTHYFRQHQGQHHSLVLNTLSGDVSATNGSSGRSCLPKNLLQAAGKKGGEVGVRRIPLWITGAPTLAPQCTQSRINPFLAFSNASFTSFFAVQAIFLFYSVERPLGLGELGFSGYLLVLLGFFSGVHLFTFWLLPRILWCWVSLSLSLSFARAFLLGRLINFTQ